ncbi:MAG: cysteine hydrolase [Alphaproteobacteria bacterium]|nr:cysteine hydrolase [Alphaproteobacteria bacterium]
MTDQMTDPMRVNVRKTLARALTTLDAKVDPAHAAVVVVDVQNDFCAEGGMLHREGFEIDRVQKMVPRLHDFVLAAREAGVLVVWIQTIYNAQANFMSDVWLEQSLRRWKGRFIDYPVCLKGGWGGDFYGNVRPLPGEPVVHKHRYGGFIGTNLDMVLRSNGIRTMIMTGAITNGCVESTARDGFFHDYYIVFLDDCTGTVNEELHQGTLFNIDRWFGQVCNAPDVVACWQKKR